MNFSQNQPLRSSVTHNNNNNLQIHRKRIVVICESFKCKISFLASFLKELGESKFGTMMIPSFSLMFGGYGTSNTKNSQNNFKNQNDKSFSSISSAVEFLQNQEEGSDLFSSRNNSSGNNQNKNGSGINGVQVITVTSSNIVIGNGNNNNNFNFQTQMQQQPSAYEIVFVESTNGLLFSSSSTFLSQQKEISSPSTANANNNSKLLMLLSNPSFACLAPFLCDIDTKACVICCEGPDFVNLGQTLGEKYVANYLVSTAESVLELISLASPSNNGKGIKYNNRNNSSCNNNLTSIKLLLSVVGWNSNCENNEIQNSTASMNEEGENMNNDLKKSNTTATTATSKNNFVLFMNIAFDYVFRWTKLILSVFLFGISQRVVSWKDKVTTMRETVQYISTRCREYDQISTGLHSAEYNHQENNNSSSIVSFGGLSLLPSYFDFVDHDNVKRNENNNDFGRFVAGLR